jgi:molybdopterin synthase catalytic subunit
MNDKGEVLITGAGFDIRAESDKLRAHDKSIGALVVFTGQVREFSENSEISEMELEHYPGMTEKMIAEIIDCARSRWQIRAVRVIHRIGRLLPGDEIVFVGVASSHRQDAFSACAYIMDFLKSRAPFWKKETGSFGQRWVDARESDEEALVQWRDVSV